MRFGQSLSTSPPTTIPPVVETHPSLMRSALACSHVGMRVAPRRGVGGGLGSPAVVWVLALVGGFIVHARSPTCRLYLALHIKPPAACCVRQWRGPHRASRGRAGRPFHFGTICLPAPPPHTLRHARKVPQPGVRGHPRFRIVFLSTLHPAAPSTKAATTLTRETHPDR